MMLSWSEVATIASLLPLSFAVVQMGYVAYKRIRSFAVARCVARISKMIMAEEEPDDVEIRSLRYRFSMGVVLDSAIFVAEKIYGLQLHRLMLIIEVCELDYYLLGCVRRSRGARRVHNLSKMSFLTNATMVAEYAEVYMDKGCSDTNFYAMAALVAARPERAMQYLERCKFSLNLHEVAVISYLMHRAGVALAYTPMLSSPNRNLQMVGIYLANHFSLLDAEEQLQRLVCSEDEEVAYMALLTLCAIHGDISTCQVGRAVQSLAPHQRIAFILRAVYNCYSLSSCEHHLSNEERAIFSHRINSYKCRIVCN